MKKIYHTDGGHGWLAVKRDELVNLNITEIISGYSYQNGDTVYLEEDMDMGTYLKAMKATGVEIELVESYHHTSPIRNYTHYTTTAKQEYEATLRVGDKYIKTGNVAVFRKLA